MLAGRNIGMFVGIFTMTATWVGGGYINGINFAMMTMMMMDTWASEPTFPRTDDDGGGGGGNGGEDDNDHRVK